MAGRTNFPPRIKARQESAKARQEKSDKLTLEQKLLKAKVGSKEHTRLMSKVKK